MGALHAGHESLIERAARENDLAVVSIFVNPTQFGPQEDFAAYPRDESADLATCERLGTAMVFAPTVDEIYPAGDATRVQPGPIASRLDLSANDRKSALALSRALLAAKADWSRGERDPVKLRDRVQRDTAVPGVALEYVSVADPLTLEELERPAERAVISLAARVGKARLIDNVLLGIALDDVA